MGFKSGKFLGKLVAYERTNVNGCGFGFIGVAAVISDVRGCGDEDLAGVRGVGKRFLITVHGGVETNLSCGGVGKSSGISPEHGTIFEQEQSGFR